jgi:hypothetical protein
MVLFLMIDKNKHYRFSASNCVSSYVSSNAKVGQNAKQISHTLKLQLYQVYMKITQSTNSDKEDNFQKYCTCNIIPMIRPCGSTTAV